MKERVKGVSGLQRVTCLIPILQGYDQQGEYYQGSYDPYSQGSSYDQSGYYSGQQYYEGSGYDQNYDYSSYYAQQQQTTPPVSSSAVSSASQLPVPVTTKSISSKQQSEYYGQFYSQSGAKMFGSAEHELLKVSYFYHSMSGARYGSEGRGVHKYRSYH